jgi:general secretion pathway protein G
MASKPPPDHKPPPHPLQYASARPLSRFTSFAVERRWIVVALVVAGCVAWVIAPKFRQRREIPYQRPRAEISVLSDALRQFKGDVGRYPTSAEGLAALYTAPVNARGWNGPYVGRSTILDSWGQPFICRFPGAHQSVDFDLSSCGADGKSGTADDVTNW